MAFDPLAPFKAAWEKGSGLVSGIADAYGGQTDYRAKAPKLRQSSGAAQLESRGAVGGQVERLEAGRGAENAAIQQNRDQAIAAANALARSGGGSQVLARRGAAIGGAQAAAAGGQQAAQVGLQREGLIAQQLSAQRLQDLQAQGLSFAEAQAQLQAELAAQGINAQISQGNAAAGQQAASLGFVGAGGLLSSERSSKTAIALASEMDDGDFVVPRPSAERTSSIAGRPRDRTPEIRTAGGMNPVVLTPSSGGSDAEGRTNIGTRLSIGHERDEGIQIPPVTYSMQPTAPPPASADGSGGGGNPMAGLMASMLGNTGQRQQLVVPQYQPVAPPSFVTSAVDAKQNVAPAGGSLPLSDEDFAAILRRYGSSGGGEAVAGAGGGSLPMRAPSVAEMEALAAGETAKQKADPLRRTAAHARLGTGQDEMLAALDEADQRRAGMPSTGLSLAPVGGFRPQSVAGAPRVMAPTGREVAIPTERGQVLATMLQKQRLEQELAEAEAAMLAALELRGGPTATAGSQRGARTGGL